MVQSLSPRMDFPWKGVLTIFVVRVIAHSAASPPLHMNHVIHVVETLEALNPDLQPIDLVRELRQYAKLDSPFIQKYLPSLGPKRLVGNATLTEYLSSAIQHQVTDGDVERGVVLSSDGTTVALAPLLLAIEAGLQSPSNGRVAGLYPLALAKSLAVSILHHSRNPSTTLRMGPDGCWDSITSPRIFTLSGLPSMATDAQVNGGMDGVILGTEMSDPSRRPAKLSTLLRRYYSSNLKVKGFDRSPRLISAKRRQNFKRLTKPAFLKKQVLATLALYQKLNRSQDRRRRITKDTLNLLVDRGLREFEHKYTVCPAIIPRCQWEAKPYRGSPTLLSLPLSFLYIHHTSTPSEPCLTFEECARDMRAMQRFHQDDRGWDDIGYSFVAGSDGYIYEGRGWHWQGAHTKGHNSKGYGVSFIGDYRESLPSKSSLDLVRQHLAMCAVEGHRLVKDYIVHGHRQVVSTTCPGDALYSNVQTWKHYKEVQS